MRVIHNPEGFPDYVLELIIEKGYRLGIKAKEVKVKINDPNGIIKIIPIERCYYKTTFEINDPKEEDGKVIIKVDIGKQRMKEIIDEYGR